MGDILDISVEEVSKVKPHCKEEIEREVRKTFKDVDRNKYGRTTQSLPEGETRGTLERGESHTTTAPWRGRRR